MAQPGMLLMLVALACGGSAAAKKVEVPRFKWGQNKELIFLSVMVRDLDEASVSVDMPSQSELQVKAKSTKGQDYELHLPLREDINESPFHWQIGSRPDKWGILIVITISKKNAHRWDLLVENPKKFKGLMDKDYTREDASLEPEEEVDYLNDHEGYLNELTEKNFNKTLAKFRTLVVNVRYPWCTQCSSQDTTFAKVAKGAKQKSKKDKQWKDAGFFVLDAREHRSMARWLGATCDHTCDYRVFTDSEREPVTVASKWDEKALEGEFRRFLGPSVHVLKTAEEEAALKKGATLVAGGFTSESSPKYGLFKRVAGQMRGEVKFSATFGKELDVALWPENQTFSMAYDGTWEDNGTTLQNWIRPRAVPLLAPWEWSLTEKYEKLGVPIAKVWLDDSGAADASFQKIVRYAMRKVAKKFLGKLAFVEMKKSTDSYNLRDFGLDKPEQFPAFGISSNASYTSLKYAFEITPDIAASAQVFFKDGDTAIAKLTAFCEQVLKGSWPEAHESGAVQTDWVKGAPKQLVWKSFAEIKHPERPLLLNVYGKYRRENEKGLKEAENLAKALEMHADDLSVATYDTSDNHIPPEFKREKYSSDAEWFWVPKEGVASITKLMKPKKDAPIKTVLEFLKKQSGLSFDVDAVNAEFEKLMNENPPVTTTPPPMPDMGGGGGGMGGMPDMGGMGMDGMGGMGAMGGMGGMPSMEGMGGMPGMGDLSGIAGMGGMPGMGEL